MIYSSFDTYLAPFVHKHKKEVAKDIINYLSKKFVNIEIIDLYKVHRKRKIDYINSKFKIGKYLSNLIVGLIWYNFYRTKGIKPINLVIKKVENGI